MSDGPPKQVLDRDLARVQMSQVLGRHLDLLKEVVDYGAGLMLRCLARSDKKLGDIIPLLVFLRQVVEMLDAVEVLLREGAVVPARIQYRVALEASVYFDFALQADTERRAA